MKYFSSFTFSQSTFTLNTNPSFGDVPGFGVKAVARVDKAATGGFLHGANPTRRQRDALRELERGAMCEDLSKPGGGPVADRGEWETG